MSTTTRAVLRELAKTQKDRRPVTIQLRGEVRLEVDGARVEGRLPGRLGRALLAFLVLNRQRVVTRDELMGALWPGNVPRDPAATLSTLLSGIRRALGADVLQGRSELRLELPPDAVVDVEVATRALESARAARGAHPEQACTSAELALDIHESPLVPLFDAPWLEEHRRIQEEERLEALELLADAALALGDAGAVRAQLAARQLVDLAPFRESGYGLLMRAHAARGNHAEALQTFERVRTLLREELGSTPSPDLRALHEHVLAAADAAAVDQPAGAPELEQARDELQPALVRSEGRPFVGREDAMDTLRRELETVAAGDRRFAFVSGEPGIGKTSLAMTFAREARDAGALVLYGRSDEETLVPYQPFVDVVSHLVLSGQVDSVGEGLRLELEELGRLVPELGRHLPASGGQQSPGVPETERYRLFEAMTTTLGRVAGERTMVLLFDDLHWADRPTLLLLRHLARAPEPKRLLVIATYRDVEVEPSSPVAELVGDVRRELPLTEIELQGLDRDETESLVRAYQGAAATPSLATRLHEQTAGNPFFLEESLRTIADPEGVPAGVREMVLRRVARLGPDATQVLGAAAVMGGSFPAGALPAVAGMSREQVAAVLDKAVAARLLGKFDRAGRLSFAHALIRKTLHDELGGVVRAHLHERIAQTLEAERAELRPHASELALHFYEARHSLGPDSGLLYARRAADRAAGALAWEEAAAHLERSLELDDMRDPPDLSDRCELLLMLGDMRVRAGHPGFSAAFAEAAAIARGRSSSQLARAAIGYGGHYYEAGVVDETLIHLCREALAKLGDDEQDLRVQVLARLAEILHFAGDTEASVELATQAVELARDLGDNRALLVATSAYHDSLLHIAHLDERVEVSAELVRMARALRDPIRLLMALQTRTFDLTQACRIDEARAASEELESIATASRQPMFEHFAVGWAASFAQMEGRLDDAERLASESAVMRARMETADAESVFAAQLVMIRISQGRLRELVEAIEHYTNEFPELAPWRAGVPVAYVSAGRDAEAALELERAIERLDEIPRDFFWLAAVILLADASWQLGHRESADVLYAALEPYAGAMVQLGYAGSLGPVSRRLGLLAAVRGDREAATAHLDTTLAAMQAAGLRLFETQARDDLAQLTTASA
jgi:DNA-binding SARP family transcriptional activator/tetratricopeptide (TPR) repeat protein